MSAARAAPVVVAGDRTHYLHSADIDAPSVEVHHMRLGDGAQVALYRFHPTESQPRDTATLKIEHGPFSLYVNLTAEELRTLAYAALQCAADLGAPATPATPAAAQALPSLDSIESRPWRLPIIEAQS